MTTTRKRTEWIDRTINEAAGTYTMTAVRQTDDMDKPEPIADIAPVVFTFAKAAAPMRVYAEMHGWAARIGDVVAQSAGTTAAAKLADAKALVDHYESGAESWTLKATRTKADPEAMLKDLLATADPEKLAKIIADAQAAIAAKVANAQG